MNRIASMSLTFTFALLTICSAAEPVSRAMSAGDLHEICVSSDEAGKAACRFYVLGLTQGISVGMSIADGKTSGGRPCVPENVSGDALELVVKMKLGSDLTVFPADRALDAAGLVAAIMISTFPCAKARQ